MFLLIQTSKEKKHMSKEQTSNEHTSANQHTDNNKEKENKRQITQPTSNMPQPFRQQQCLKQTQTDDNSTIHKRHQIDNNTFHSQITNHITLLIIQKTKRGHSTHLSTNKRNTQSGLTQYFFSLSLHNRCSHQKGTKTHRKKEE